MYRRISISSNQGDAEKMDRRSKRAKYASSQISKLAKRRNASSFQENLYCQNCKCMMENPVSPFAVRELCCKARFRCTYQGCYDDSQKTLAFEELEGHLRTCRYRTLPSLVAMIKDKSKFTETDTF